MVFVVKDGEGVLKNFDTVGAGTTGDPFKMTSPLVDIALEVSRGAVSGVELVTVFGVNESIPADTKEDVHSCGGSYPFAAAASITHVKQVVDQSTLRGETVEVVGLDISWQQVTQTISLNSSNTTTLVGLTTPLIRVHSAKSLSNVVATQDIRVTNFDGTVCYASILATKGRSSMSVFTVPAGKTGYIVKFWGSVFPTTGSDPEVVKFYLELVDRLNDYASMTECIIGVPRGVGKLEHLCEYYVPVQEKTDVLVSAYPVSEGAEVSAGFNILLVDN